MQNVVIAIGLRLRYNIEEVIVKGKIREAGLKTSSAAQ